MRQIQCRAAAIQACIMLMNNSRPDSIAEARWQTMCQQHARHSDERFSQICCARTHLVAGARGRQRGLHHEVGDGLHRQRQQAAGEEARKQAAVQLVRCRGQHRLQVTPTARTLANERQDECSDNILRWHSCVSTGTQLCHAECPVLCLSLQVCEAAPSRCSM